jgi:two-component system phosphate regulon sensor histidine kinase PhoR
MARTIRFRYAIPLSLPLMIAAIIGIGVFQAYWMRKLYSQERMELSKEVDVAFQDVVYKLQLDQIRKDTFFTKHDLPPNIFLFNLLDSLRTKFADSLRPGHLFGHDRGMAISIQTIDHRDTTAIRVQDTVVSADSGAPHILRYFNSRSGSEPPLSVGQIDSAYRKELFKNHITIPFRVERMQRKPGEIDQPPPSDQLQTNYVFVGLSKTYAYQASFDSPSRFILSRMLWPIAAGVFLLVFTALTFVVLYRNLQQQRRLSQYKNDFISNMTHELKTPMSTIKVAVEALRHFDALDDPKRTREYLDISAMELQRLSLLVDKVMRLSQFENNEMEFRLTTFDLRDLAAEVLAEMRLPFEKAGAVVRLTAGEGEGEAGAGRFNIRADRSHLSSVISNLLDNALKYSRESPVITVQVARDGELVVLSVTDNGIGIPAVYLGRIFEKFFRVPSGDHHNIKGYGLGLNYVHHIVSAHRGLITVESKEGKGSAFTIKLRGV